MEKEKKVYDVPEMETIVLDLKSGVLKTSGGDDPIIED